MKLGDIKVKWWIDEYNLVWIEILGKKDLLGVYYES